MGSDEIQVRVISWRRSRRSLGNGECIEVGLTQGRVAVRDSKAPGSEIITCSADAWRSFANRLKRTSEFDL